MSTSMDYVESVKLLTTRKSPSWLDRSPMMELTFEVRVNVAIPESLEAKTTDYRAMNLLEDRMCREADAHRHRLTHAEGIWIQPKSAVHFLNMASVNDIRLRIKDLPIKDRLALLREAVADQLGGSDHAVA